MTYLVVGLALLSAVLYALYERTRGQQARNDLAEAKKQVVQAQVDAVAERARYERLVADLKRQLALLEETFYASAAPDALVARFHELFPRPAPPDAAHELPPGPAAGDAGGPGDPVSGG